MDMKATENKLLAYLKRYKYVVLVVSIGIILLLLPIEKKEAVRTATTITTKIDESGSISKDLTKLLSKVKGAGKVEVYFMTAEGEETIYQTDEDQSEDTSGSSNRSQTVIVADSDRNEYGLVKKINPPKYSGAIILCEGADNAEVQLQLIQAVANLTGLGTNRISVLKMK